MASGFQMIHTQLLLLLCTHTCTLIHMHAHAHTHVHSHAHAHAHTHMHPPHAHTCTCSRTQVKVMCSKVEGEVNSFTQELEKFSSRWHQLKPKDDLLEGDKMACTNALSSLKERRAEFNELIDTANKLR